MKHISRINNNNKLENLFDLSMKLRILKTNEGDMSRP